LARKFFVSLLHNVARSLLLALLATGPLAAAPAPWYLWTSQLNGQRVCQQSAPGPGWVREEIAFRTAQCRIPLPR
jgi:hypothetical protein